jgi:hypothetical protein
MMFPACLESRSETRGSSCNKRYIWGSGRNLLSVMSAEAGIQSFQYVLDPGLRRGDDDVAISVAPTATLIRYRPLVSLLESIEDGLVVESLLGRVWLWHSTGARFVWKNSVALTYIHGLVSKTGVSRGGKESR